MPELAEIRFMADSLYDFTNTKLRGIHITKFSKYNKIPIPNLKELRNELPLRIKRIFSKGKRIFILLEKGFFIIMNMGLTGELSLSRTKHHSITFEISKTKKFYLNDQIKYATIKIDNKNYEKYYNEIGYDPLSENITFNEFYKKYIEKKRSKKTLAEKLLDQKIFGGIGNYLRAEILYDTMINPFQDFDEVSICEWKKIYKSYKKMSVKYYYDNNKGFEAYHRKDKEDITKTKLGDRYLWHSTKFKLK